MKVTLGGLILSSFFYAGCASNPKSSELLTPEPPASEEEMRDSEKTYSFVPVPPVKLDFISEIPRSYVETVPQRKHTEYYLDENTVSAILYLPKPDAEPVLLRVYQDKEDNALYFSEYGNIQKVIWLYHNNEFLPGDSKISIEEVEGH